VTLRRAAGLLARLFRREDSGRWGERMAARELERRGFRILGTRVRVGLRDEIDLLARHGAVLVFVEVKTRRSERFGRPADAVDRRKRHRMSRAAVRYLQSLDNPRILFRFDVVEVVGLPGDAAPAIRHIERAFPLDRRYMLPC
jgi:putative endonuclease